MTKLIQDLLALQTILKLGPAATPEQKDEIEPLKLAIPPAILGHFLRQLANGRRGIALVHHGVCSECHIRVSHATVHMLGRSNDLLLCENCGAFIALDPVDAAALAAPAAPLPKPRRVRKPRAVAIEA